MGFIFKKFQYKNLQNFHLKILFFFNLERKIENNEINEFEKKYLAIYNFNNFYF